jgi:hypothetical protein
VSSTLVSYVCFSSCIYYSTYVSLNIREVTRTSKFLLHATCLAKARPTMHPHIMFMLQRQKATVVARQKCPLSLTTITAGFISPNIKQPLGHSFQLTSLICGTYEILCSCLRQKATMAARQNAPYHSPQ